MIWLPPLAQLAHMSIAHSRRCVARSDRFRVTFRCWHCPGHPADSGWMNDSAGVFEEQRPRLFGLAYRLLASASDAEDAVPDAFLRRSAADPDSVVAPSAWLTTVVTNLCRNRLASAPARRERYVGTWLPEPVLTSDGTLGPLEAAEQRDSVSLALLTLLEQLTPAQPAVLVLLESFGYGHRESAGILGMSEAGCRQLHRRARQRLGGPRPRVPPAPCGWERPVDALPGARRGGRGGGP